MNTTWMKALAVAAASGAATALLSRLEIGAEDKLGAHVRPLDFAELENVAASGALVGGLLYVVKKTKEPNQGP